MNINGTSPPANRQVNKLNKEAEYKKYEANVTEEEIPGRKAGLQKEQARVDDYAATHDGKGPPGNTLPQPQPQPESNE